MRANPLRSGARQGETASTKHSIFNHGVRLYAVLFLRIDAQPEFQANKTEHLFYYQPS
jgi:hypothetical protein